MMTVTDKMIIIIFYSHNHYFIIGSSGMKGKTRLNMANIKIIFSDDICDSSGSVFMYLMVIFRPLVKNFRTIMS